MHIINDIQLDYCDVLIAAQTTTVNHRGDVNIKRHFKNLLDFDCCPIMNANMTQTGTFEVAEKLIENGMIGCIHKFYTGEQIKEFLDSGKIGSLGTNRFFITIGLRNQDEELMKLKYSGLDKYFWSIMIDVPNAYIPAVEDLVKRVRNEFPDKIIAVGNVCTGDRTQELIKAGANLIKVGIGPSCFTGDTLIKTSKGLIKIKNIEENDFVLTHTGTYKKVINKFQFKNEDSLLDINGIKCTKNHKFFVINKNDIEKINENNYQEYAYWMEAKDLTQNQLLIKLK